MKRKEFLEKLEKSKGKNIQIELTKPDENSNKKIIIEKIEYEIKNDIICIKSAINTEYFEINLNTIREIRENQNGITLYSDNKEDMQIKISAI